MRKKIGPVCAIYAMVLFAYVFLFLVIPFEKNVAAWAAFGFTILSLIMGTFIWLWVFRKGETLKSKVYGFPILRLGILYTVLQLMFGVVVCLVNAFIEVPAWIVFSLSVLGLCCVAIGLIVADNAIDLIEQQEAELHVGTQTTLRFQIDMAHIMDQCENEQVKKQLIKLSEEIKYSDPVSNAKLEELENEILKSLEELCETVNGNIELTMAKIKKIEGMVADRNRKCKVMK